MKENMCFLDTNIDCIFSKSACILYLHREGQIMEILVSMNFSRLSIPYVPSESRTFAIAWIKIKRRVPNKC